MTTARWVLWVAGGATPILAACNYTEGECYPPGQGGAGGGVGAGGIVVPGGPGGFGDLPPDTEEADACNAPSEAPAEPEESSPGGLKVFCLKADHGDTCAARCAAKGVACGPIAAHAYKTGAGLGLLFSCNTLLFGWMCGYHYPNGDDCYYPIGLPYPKLCSYSGTE